MMIRAFKPEDLDEIRQLHNKYYSEFDFPNFLNLLNAFIIQDKNEIIMAGGIEQVAEAVLVTNKAASQIKIGRALVEAQEIALFTCKRFGLKELYAFVNRSEYAKHLVKHGFREHGLTTLSMKVP